MLTVNEFITSKCVYFRDEVDIFKSCESELADNLLSTVECFDHDDKSCGEINNHKYTIEKCTSNINENMKYIKVSPYKLLEMTDLLQPNAYLYFETLNDMRNKCSYELYNYLYKEFGINVVQDTGYYRKSTVKDNMVIQCEYNFYINGGRVDSCKSSNHKFTTKLLSDRC